MLHEINSAKARSSRRNFQKQERALRATCLLCRILWPIVVQHRHLILNAINRQSRPYVQGYATSDLTNCQRLVFHYSDEISIDDHSS